MGSILSRPDPTPATGPTSCQKNRQSNPFGRYMEFLDENNKPYRLFGQLDTACDQGNWISRRRIQELGKEHLISTDVDLPQLLDASGNLVPACGEIKLDWKWVGGSRMYNNILFNVFGSEACDIFDVIIGRPFILDHNLVMAIEGSFRILVRHKGKKDEEAIAAERQKQEKEAAALAERKKKEQEKRDKKKEGGMN